jgi:hypothetical protein
MAKPTPVVFNSSSPWATRFQQIYLLGEASGTPQDSGSTPWPLNTVSGVAPTWVQGSDGLCIRCAGNGAYYTNTTSDRAAAYPILMAVSFATTSATATYMGLLADTVHDGAAGGVFGDFYGATGAGNIAGNLRITAGGSVATITTSASAQSDKAVHCLWASFSSVDHRFYVNPGTGGVKNTNTTNVGSTDGNLRRICVGGWWRATDAPGPGYFQGDVYFAAAGYGAANVPTDAECLDFVNNPYQLYVAQAAPAANPPRILVAA